MCSMDEISPASIVQYTVYQVLSLVIHASLLDFNVFYNEVCALLFTRQ
ncbi:MAG: hypothetical protein ACI9ES_001826 [Oceanospirillaceae bacterium]|jgi:hypothetical protein